MPCAPVFSMNFTFVSAALTVRFLLAALVNTEHTDSNEDFMTRRIVTIIALSGLVALDAHAQPSSSAAPAAPAKAEPGKGPGAPGAKGPGAKGPGAKGPGAPNRPDAPGLKGKGPGADEAKDTPGAAKDEKKDAKLQDRVAKLRERAEKLRAEGKERAAAGLERQAERLEKGPSKSPVNREKIRRARKLARIKLLHRRYGEALQQGDVRDEVQTHARRSANLSRMKSIVNQMEDGDKKTDMLKRINRLMAKENARHSRTMAKLTKNKDTLAGKKDKASKPGADDKPRAKETK